MPVTIIKPPCGRCGRRDLPVYVFMNPPLCDVCHAAWLKDWARDAATRILEPLASAIATEENRTPNQKAAR